MKIKDLLNKIANNEEVPKEIMFRGELCSFDNEHKDYYCQEYSYIVWYLIDSGCNMNEVLDTELDIIEEKPKKIEKLTHLDFADKVAVGNKINEIIDYLLEKESDE